MPWKTIGFAVLISVAVAALRFFGQVQGWITTSSGGGLHPVGVVWLPFLFGPVFASRLARSGSAPRTRNCFPASFTVSSNVAQLVIQ